MRPGHQLPAADFVYGIPSRPEHQVVEGVSDLIGCFPTEKTQGRHKVAKLGRHQKDYITSNRTVVSRYREPLSPAKKMKLVVFPDQAAVDAPAFGRQGRAGTPVADCIAHVHLFEQGEEKRRIVLKHVEDTKTPRFDTGIGAAKKRAKQLSAVETGSSFKIKRFSKAQSKIDTRR